MSYLTKIGNVPDSDEVTHGMAHWETGPPGTTCDQCRHFEANARKKWGVRRDPADAGRRTRSSFYKGQRSCKYFERG
jgi:hypothetical protein